MDLARRIRGDAAHDFRVLATDGSAAEGKRAQNNADLVMLPYKDVTAGLKKLQEQFPLTQDDLDVRAGLKKDDASAEFKKADKNGDGKIDKSEFK